MPDKHIEEDKVSGEPIALEIGGEEIQISPLGPRDMGKAKAHIRGLRRAAYQSYISSLDPGERPSKEEQREERSEIMRQFISDLEVARWWLNEVDGMLWLIHRAVNKERSDNDEDKPNLISKDEIASWFDDEARIKQITETILNDISGFEIEEKGSGESSGGEESAPSPDGSTSAESQSSTE